LGFAGSSVSGSIAQAVFIGIVTLVFTGVTVRLPDRVGRRLRFWWRRFVVPLAWSPRLVLPQPDDFLAPQCLGRPGRYDVPNRSVRDQPGTGVLMIAKTFRLRLRSKAGIATVSNWAFNFLGRISSSAR
jgi:hypothetical protein